MADKDDKPIKPPSESFKEGWDNAGKERRLDPELLQGMVELYGIHPDRAENFARARAEFIAGRGEEPDPEKFKEPVILPYKKDGPDLKQP